MGGEKGSLIDRSFHLPLTIGSSWRRTNNICRQLSLFRFVPCTYIQNLSPVEQYSYGTGGGIMSYSPYDDVSALSPVASSAHQMMWGDPSAQTDAEIWRGDSSSSGPDFTKGAHTELDELYLENHSQVGFGESFRKSADVKILRHPRPQRPGPLDTAISALSVDDSTGPATTYFSPQRSGFSF